MVDGPVPRSKGVRVSGQARADPQLILERAVHSGEKTPRVRHGKKATMQWASDSTSHPLPGNYHADPGPTRMVKGVCLGHEFHYPRIRSACSVSAWSSRRPDNSSLATCNGTPPVDRRMGSVGSHGAQLGNACLSHGRRARAGWVSLFACRGTQAPLGSDVLPPGGEISAACCPLGVYFSCFAISCQGGLLSGP